MGRCHFISAWREQKCNLNGPQCLVLEFQKCNLNGPAGHGCHLNRPGGSTPDSQECYLNHPAGCHLNGPGRSFSSQPRRSCLPGEGEEEGAEGPAAAVDGALLEEPHRAAGASRMASCPSLRALICQKYHLNGPTSMPFKWSDAI